MSDPLSELPEVESNDPEPVAVAIETARALFRTGDRLDALRWLRRAAERAEESGDDVRAVHLARSAADLSTALQSLLPPPTDPVPSPPLPPVSSPSSRRSDEAMALLPYDDFSDKTQVDATAPVVRDALHSGVQITELPVSDDSRHTSNSITMPSPSSSEPTATSAQFLPVETVKPATRPALRVAVSRDPATPGTWLVRPLAEGSKVPPGCEEALLVGINAHSKLLP